MGSPKVAHDYLSVPLLVQVARQAARAAGAQVTAIDLGRMGRQSGWIQSSEVIYMEWRTWDGIGACSSVCSFGACVYFFTMSKRERERETEGDRRKTEGKQKENRRKRHEKEGKGRKRKEKEGKRKEKEGRK